MPEIEQKENEIPESVIRDIVKEFNIIVDPVKDDKSEVIKMDSPEALKSKGYETFGEHFFNAGAEQERKKNDALNTKRAEFLRSQNVSDEVISAMLAIK